MQILRFPESYLPISGSCFWRCCCEFCFAELIDRTVSTNESIAIQKARQLYTSCMHNSFRTSHFTDYKHLPIYQVLSAQGIGEWPILQGSSWNRSEFNLERLLGQLFTHQVQSIFDLYVTQDEVEPTKYLLQVINYYFLLLKKKLYTKAEKLNIFLFLWDWDNILK